MNKKVAIVIPSHNEEGNVAVMVTVIHKVMDSLPYDYDIVFVDDGSTDDTQQILKGISQNDTRVKHIFFSRNFGKDNALKAGIDLVNSDCLITLDADLQHPPNIIPIMLEKWEQGFDVIYAYRESANPHASFFSKITSKLFWSILNMFSSLELEDGISDFRLLDIKVVYALKEINEFEIFFRGMVKWVGFNQIGIPYTPNERIYGETTYSRKALLKLAIQGITSFSTRPLYIAIYLGLGLSFLAFGFFITYVVYSVYYGHAISGWASLICTVVFFGGLNLIVMGIIGIYVGKLFMQSKQRPNYLIKSTNYK